MCRNQLDHSLRPVLILFLLLIVGGITNTAASQITLTTFASSEQAAPGVAGGQWRFLNAPFVSNDGGVAFSARMLQQGPVDSSNESGLWGGTSGNIQLIAREGSTAPGTGGRPWRSLNLVDPMLGDGGRVAFIANVTAPQGGNFVNAGVWAGTIGGTIDSVAFNREPAAGFSNEVYNHFGSGGSRPDVNAAGQVVFEGSSGVLSSSGNFFSNSVRNNLWIGSPGNVTLVAEGRNGGGNGGDLAPGMPGRVWSGFLSPVINDNGQIAFRGRTSPADNSGGFSGGIWAGSPQNLSLIAELGDIAAGTGGKTWNDFGSGSSSSGPAINNSGTVAFNAEVVDTGGNRSFGIWATEPAGLRRIAISGQTAPGDADLTIPGFQQVSLNDGGQFAIEASVAGPGVNANNNNAIYATDAFGQLMKVYRERESIMIDGSPQSITSLGLSETGAISGDPRQGNARLAIDVTYSGSMSAVVVADLNDVYVDAGITSDSLTLNDATRTYETAGDLYVGTETSGAAEFTIAPDSNNPNTPVTMIAHDGYFGAQLGTTGLGYIEQNNLGKFTGNLFLGGDGVGQVEIRDGGQLTVDGSTLIQAGSSLTVTNGGQFSALGGQLTNDGTLSVDATSSLVLGSNSVLSGNGRFDLALVADAGVVLSPGNSPGTLSITDLTLADGAYHWEFFTLPGDGSAGTDWDLVAADLLDIASNSQNPFTINVLDADLTTFDETQSYQWLIAQSDSPINGFDPSDFVFDLSGASGFADQGEFSIGLVNLPGGGQGISANFTPAGVVAPVPEPASLALFLALGTVVLLWRCYQA